MMQHVAMDSRVKITKTCKKRIIRYARLIKFLEDSVSVVALERTVKTEKKKKTKATCSQSPGLNKERISKEWKELSQLTNERTNTSANSRAKTI